MYRKCICYPYNTFKYFCHRRCQSISLLKIENIWMPLLFRQGAEEAVWGSQGDTEDIPTVSGQAAATAAAAEGDRGCGTHTKVLPPIQTGTCTPLLSLSLSLSLSHLNSNELQQKCTWFFLKGHSPAGLSWSKSSSLVFSFFSRVISRVFSLSLFLSLKC